MTRSSRAAEWLIGGGLLLASAAASAEESANAALQPLLLDVTLNEQKIAEPQLLLRDAAGRLYASEAQIRAWKLRLPKAGALTYDGDSYYPIDGLGAVRASLDEAAQALVVTASAALFERQSQAAFSYDRSPMNRPGTGGFLNYDLFAERSAGGTSMSGVFETGMFTPHGVAISRFAGRAGGGATGLTRLESSWTIDRPLQMNSLRFGDGTSRGGPGAAPLRFAGIQFATNFAVQPGFVTAPLPSLEGSAAVPSVVDVYVNNVLQSSRNVTPGPFEITNVPVVSGGGTVQLVVRDLLGRETVSTQNYYASTQMLRKGLHEFSYEVGMLRRGFGTRSNSYGELMASGAHRYGLSDNLTAEAHAQLSRGRQQVSAGLTASWPTVALASGWVAASRSGVGSGWSAGASLERRTAGFSLGARGELASAAYASVGGAASERPSRYSVQAFADLPWKSGSFGINAIHRENRERVSETLLGATANVGVGRRASLQLYAQRTAAGKAQTLFGGHLTLSLGKRRSVSASIEAGSGTPSGHVAFQQDAPFGGGTGFRASANMGRLNSGSLQVDHRTGSAAFSAHLGHSAGGTGLRLGASGAVGMAGGQPFLSRTLGGSFATVRVPGQAGVRVYADNQLVGTTDEDGSLIVPALRPYERNVIRIEQADLPLDVQVEETELVVRPYARSAATVTFASRTERGALLQILLEDGTPLPAGASVIIEGRDEGLVAVSGGEVYVADLSGTARLTAIWPAGSCTFSVEVPPGDDPQPRIAGLRCLPEARYAAR